MSGFFKNIANLVNTLSKNAFWYITQKRYEREVLEYPLFLPFVPDKYKTRKICQRTVEKDLCTLKIVPDKYKTQSCVKELLVVIQGH